MVSDNNKKKVSLHVRSYLRRIPSASMVNKIENLLSTVNIGRLQKEHIQILSWPNIRRQ